MKGLKSKFVAGALFVSVLGTLLHFAYAFSGNNWLVGLFTPIHESVWEHAKLTFFPMLLYTVYLCKKEKEAKPCIQSAMLSATLLSVLLILVLFYTYSGILGFHIAFADIAIFYISVILSFCAAYALSVSCKAAAWNTRVLLLNIVMAFLFILFTFCPPSLPLFIRP